MTKIYLDDKTLKNIIIGDIESSISKLNSAIYDVGDLSIPSNFDYAVALKKLPDDINNLRVALNKKKEILKSSVNNYKNIEQRNLDEILLIKNIELSNRKRYE